MDIPKFKHLKKNTRLKIKGPDGPFTFNIIRANRGGEGERNTLTVYGTCEQKLEFSHQCYISFAGKEFQGSFEYDSKIMVPSLWAGTFVTMIDLADFWE